MILDKLIKKQITTLSKDENKIILLYLSGLSMDAIGGKLNSISKQAVSKKLERICEKILMPGTISSLFDEICSQKVDIFYIPLEKITIIYPRLVGLICKNIYKLFIYESKIITNKRVKNNPRANVKLHQILKEKGLPYSIDIYEYKYRVSLETMLYLASSKEWVYDKQTKEILAYKKLGLFKNLELWQIKKTTSVWVFFDRILFNDYSYLIEKKIGTPCMLSKYVGMMKSVYKTEGYKFIQSDSILPFTMFDLESVLGKLTQASRKQYFKNIEILIEKTGDNCV